MCPARRSAQSESVGWCSSLAGPCSPEWGTPMNLIYLGRMPNRVGGPPEVGCSPNVTSDQSHAGTGGNLTVTQTLVSSVSYVLHFSVYIKPPGSIKDFQNPDLLLL